MTAWLLSLRQRPRFACCLAVVASISVLLRCLPTIRDGQWPADGIDRALLGLCVLPYIALYYLGGVHSVQSGLGRWSVVLVLVTFVSVVDIGGAAWILFASKDPLAEIGLISIPLALLATVMVVWSILVLLNLIK